MTGLIPIPELFSVGALEALGNLKLECLWLSEAERKRLNGVLKSGIEYDTTLKQIIEDRSEQNQNRKIVNFYLDMLVEVTTTDQTAIYQTGRQRMSDCIQDYL